MLIASLVAVAVVAVFVGPERARPFIIAGLVSLLVVLAIAPKLRR